MHRCKDRGFCCGAGGARMWMEEKIGKRINAERTEEALELDPDVISTACPFCITMLSDALNTKKQNGEAKDHVEVLDVSQILLRSMAPVGAPGTESGPEVGTWPTTPRAPAPRPRSTATRAARCAAATAGHRARRPDGRVRELFENDPGTAHLAVLPGASVSPAGDLVLADVARESADALVSALRELNVHRDGAIAITSVDAAVSSAARRAEERAPGDAADAVVWEQVVRTTDADSALSVSYLAFLTIAMLLAAIAIINDSAILTIGAMVLGPEFVPLAALAVAVVQGRPAQRPPCRDHPGRRLRRRDRADGVRDPRRPRSGLVRHRTAGRRPPADRLHHRTRQVVARRGGARRGGRRAVADVGEERRSGRRLHLRHHRAGGRGHGGLAGPRGRTEFLRAATQLGINLAGIIVAATATLAVQRAVWRRMPGVVPRTAAGTADHRPGRGSHRRPWRTMPG